MTDAEIYTYQARWMPYISRAVGSQDAEDFLNEWFIRVAEANQAGRIEGSPTRYAWGTLRHMIYARWSQIAFERLSIAYVGDALEISCTGKNPEQAALAWERERISVETLRVLKPRQREILTRFYVNGESGESVRASMGLSRVQYRLLKSRSKARFTEIGLGRIAPQSTNN